MPSSLGFQTLTPSFLLHKATRTLDRKETYGLARLLAAVDKRDVTPEQSRPAFFLAQNVLRHVVAMVDAAEVIEQQGGHGGEGGEGGTGTSVAAAASSTPEKLGNAVHMSQADVETYLVTKGSSAKDLLRQQADSNLSNFHNEDEPPIPLTPRQRSVVSLQARADAADAALRAARRDIEELNDERDALRRRVETLAKMNATAAEAMDDEESYGIKNQLTGGSATGGFDQMTSSPARGVKKEGNATITTTVVHATPMPPFLLLWWNAARA